MLPSSLAAHGETNAEIQTPNIEYRILKGAEVVIILHSTFYILHSMFAV